MNAFKKIIRPCSVKDGNVYCAIAWDGKRLSITGVVGPMQNGDARGGAGQIEMSLEQHYPEGTRMYADRWNAATFARFLEVWRVWHLNDMRAGCEHQRAGGWQSCQGYHKTDEQCPPPTMWFPLGIAWRCAWCSRGGYGVVAARGVSAVTCPDCGRPAGIPVGPEPWPVALARVNPFASDKRCANDALGVPCPICGYKYGTAWLHEDVPADVLTFLQSLPDTDTPCPWRTL